MDYKFKSMLSLIVQLGIFTIVTCKLIWLPVLSRHFTMATFSPVPLFDATLGQPRDDPAPDYGTLTTE